MSLEPVLQHLLLHAWNCIAAWVGHSLFGLAIFGFGWLFLFSRDEVV